MGWLRKIMPLIMVLYLTVGAINTNADQSIKKNGPVLNNGKKWRIAFCKSEPYQDYASNFYYIIRGLEEAGWLSGIKELPFKEGQDDTLVMWRWLVSHNVGQYMEFVKDAYYDLKKMTAKSGMTKESQIIKRLQAKKDIDLMLVTGTAAGLALAKGDHQVPTLIFSTSDPVGAGIIKTAEDPGKDNIWAHVDQGR